MKKIITLCYTILLSATFAFAQDNSSIIPYSFEHSINATVPEIVMPAHDFSADIAYAETFEKEGNYPLFAKHFEVNTTCYNSGVWTELGNGDRVWRLKLKSAGALSSALFFDNTFIPEGATMSVYSPDHAHVFNYTYENNQGNMLMSTEFIQGEEQIIEYFEPLNVKGQGKIHITEMSHQYRSIMADPCEVNVVCTPEGTNWVDEKKGVVRIYVVGPSGAGYCSGSLINNTALDCKRYILTALHCGVSSTATHFNSWVFRFNFEATLCTGQPDTYGTTTNQFTGCTKISDSGDGGGSTGSDFLLVEMTSTSSPTWWSGVYWNGWTRSTAAPTGGGVGIHHPAGSNKKISAYTATPTSTSWGGSVANTHWQMSWVATTNGHGVTEGGSSGSPLFNSVGLIVGTLTGGSSYCSPASALDDPDAYGKMSYHWLSNGTAANRRLLPWLDPSSTGVTTLAGGYSPCTATGIVDYGENTDVSVYPNPNDGSFNVILDFPKSTDVTISVLNVIGQTLSSKKISNTMSGTFAIDITNEESGIYFVEIKTNDSRVVKK
ncbi:MAG: T9SS type A sorting domain-containing protein [Bacteroidetes bacterium]|nr:T9SS type A sorting domain-containing protein [Bacteroidota bacterium]